MVFCGHFVFCVLKVGITGQLISYKLSTEVAKGPHQLIAIAAMNSLALTVGSHFASLRNKARKDFAMGTSLCLKARLHTTQNV